MSGLIEDQGNYLQLLQFTSKLQRAVLLTTITKPQLKALYEITHNVLKGTFVIAFRTKTIEEIQENINPFGEKKSTRREKLKALQSASTAVVLLLNFAGASLWTI